MSSVPFSTEAESQPSTWRYRPDALGEAVRTRAPLDQFGLGAGPRMRRLLVPGDQVAIDRARPEAADGGECELVSGLLLADGLVARDR